MDEPDLHPMAAALKRFAFTYVSIADSGNSQVWRGGFDTSSFDAKTLEAFGIPRLHLTGEVLDVDGPCGGYNLHWAFATGLLSGWAVAADVIGTKGER